MKKKHQDRYESIAHAKTRLRYHIIFSTKYRRKCLTQIRDSIFNSFQYAQERSHFKILKMELDKDHIHFLVKFKPTLSIEQVVRRMKQLSTNYLWKHEKNYLKQFYLKDKVLWSGGYFCSTIGEVSEETIRKYIELQG